MRKLHVANDERRNATIAVVAVKPEPGPRSGKGGQPVEFRRYVTAGEGTLNADLVANFGEPYAEQLIDGDPEVDFEAVGAFIGHTHTILLDAGGNPMYRSPQIVDVSYGPDGAEKERKPPQDTAPTVDDIIPLRWTGRLLPRNDMVRRFAIRRTLQLQHVDGVTYDFLHSMAEHLDSTDSVVLMAGGENGKEPIVLNVNGSPYRGFLDGRVDGSRYRLLLHLSNMELKQPPPKPEKTAPTDGSKS